MQNEIYDIYKLYESTASINNTTRNTGSYQYAPAEYSQIRHEQEESALLKKKIYIQLSSSLDKARAGTKESYQQLLFTLKEIEKDITSLLT
jgi:hypothetical protein